MRIARGFILLCIFLLGFPISAAAQDGRRIETTENADYFGFDLRTEKDVSLDQCKALCLEDQQCRAFTYNSKAQWCFLKSDFTRSNPSEGAVAGRVVVEAAAPDLGVAPALRFVPEHVLREAQQYRDKLLRDAAPGDSGFLSLVSMAGQALNRGDSRAAMRAYYEAIAMKPEDAGLWTGLARASRRRNPAGR
ncbi:PAN domain-containing protein [Paracoccus methylarcula]|uniref:PAN domain-containing protein n=1 Tax=Paracoccus methylarcula TaxID=72022 RepID=UPI001B861D53|nr:PAN domain-containing protein [Paracoccus methylarcula]